MPKTRNELRCICCNRQPILAMFGLDEFNRVYLHIKVYKGQRIFGEILVEQGSKIRIRCRECLRWYRIVVGVGIPKLEESEAPQTEVVA